MATKKSTATTTEAKPRTSSTSSSSSHSSKTDRVVESLRQAFNAQFGREVVPEGGYKDEDMPNYVDPKEGT